jgi:ABC-2 type transport system ATP-binding protein
MLQVRNLRKEFDTVVAVDGVSLRVERGELFGLLGPNGAGKTTTIRTVLNIIAPDSGEILFDGKPFTEQTWNIIGYLPEERGLYRKSRVLNTVAYFGALKGMEERDARREAHRWLERFSLVDRAGARINELSKGNQQKVQFITAVLHRPQLLILDEPFAGFDPVNQVLLKDILLELRSQNVAIIFSTHQMEQVEKLCDNIALINKGKPVLNGSLRDVKQRHGKNSVHLEFGGDGSLLKSLPGIRKADIYQNYAELELVDISKAGQLVKTLDERILLRKFEVVEPSLNSIFIDVVGGVPETPPDAEPALQKQVPVTPSKTGLSSVDKRAVIIGIVMGIVALFLVIRNFFSADPNWPLAAMFAVFSVASVVRPLMSRQKTKTSAGRPGKGSAE